MYIDVSIVMQGSMIEMDLMNTCLFINSNVQDVTLGHLTLMKWISMHLHTREKLKNLKMNYQQRVGGLHSITDKTIELGSTGDHMIFFNVLQSVEK